MKNKIISNFQFLIIIFSIYGVSYLFDKYLSNPKITILIFYIAVCIYVVIKWYRYFIKCNSLILKKYNLKQIVFTFFIVVWFLFGKQSHYNPEIWGLTKLQWMGIGFFVLGSVWLFQFISITKNGIYKPKSFVKTYYSELTTFELTDNTISYTTTNNERYYAEILKPSSKTRALLLKRIDQYLNKH